MENKGQRLYYTFGEAISAIDIAKLTSDIESLNMNATVYILVIDICIDEFLNNDIDEDEKQKAIEFYKNLEEQRSKENKKYHMYQY